MVMDYNNIIGLLTMRILASIVWSSLCTASQLNINSLIGLTEGSAVNWI